MHGTQLPLLKKERSLLLHHLKAKKKISFQLTEYEYNIVIINESYCYTSHATQKVQIDEKKWSLWEMETLKKKRIYLCYRHQKRRSQINLLNCLQFSVLCSFISAMFMLEHALTTLYALDSSVNPPFVVYWISIDLFNNSLRFTLKHDYYFITSFFSPQPCLLFFFLCLTSFLCT